MLFREAMNGRTLIGWLVLGRSLLGNGWLVHSHLLMLVTYATQTEQKLKSLVRKLFFSDSSSVQLHLRFSFRSTVNAKASRLWSV